MQKIINLVLLLAIAVLSVLVGMLWLDRQADAPDGAETTAQVAEAPVPEALDGAALEAAIEDFLVSNPRVLQRAAEALQVQVAAEEAQARSLLIAGLESEIYDDPDNIVLGNPDGDVTLVEFFDYNCTYCRQVVPDVLELIAEDPGLRVILKEYPILSAGSLEAARVGLVVNRHDVDYALYHAALMSARGNVGAADAVAAAVALGLNRMDVGLAMESSVTTSAIERNLALGRQLGVTGTPSFILGNEVIPGMQRKADLAVRIANVRACGATVCP